MMRKKFLLVLVAIMVMGMMLIGCAVDGDNSGTSPGQDGGETSSETYNWRMVGVYTKGSTLGLCEQAFAEKVTELSGGELTITYYGVGELGSATQVMDMVREGTVELGADWPGYWTGVNTAFEPLATSMMGMNAWDYLLWVKAGGGQELYDEIYGMYGLKYFPTVYTNMESGFRSASPITSLDDFEGLKVRCAGMTAPEVLSRLGATPITVAANELYESMQRGVIDALEYSQPSADYDMGLYEVAQYWLTPGFHQTGSVLGVMINEEAYNSLPEQLQAILGAAADYVATSYSSMNCYNDAAATDAMLEAGVEITTLSDEELATIENIKNEVTEEYMEANELYAKVVESQMEYMEIFSNQRDFMGDYGWGKTWTLGQ